MESVGVSEIWTQMVRVESKHTYHLATSTARKNEFLTFLRFHHFVQINHTDWNVDWNLQVVLHISNQEPVL